MRLATGRELTGPAGSAVEILATADPDDPPDWAATVAMWFLHCPGQSPAWSHYTLGIVHLRPIDGVAPATITIPAATHQVLLNALDPLRNPDPLDSSTWQRLSPVNVCEQIQLPDDRAAVELALRAAEAIVEGLLWAEPPLSGQVEPWRTVLLKSAAHARGEPHAP